jgi:type I restriction-modification system DNA methylase subunit
VGTPPTSSADWGWVQHMAASLSDHGKMAVVLDTGAVSRGSGNQGSNRERDIRKVFVERDLVEAVVLLPENLFYNTTAPGIILEAWPKSHSFLSDNFGMTPVQYTNEICWHYSSPAPNGQIFG